MVLQAIWEPDFEKMNRSFGFRPNKSCGDALTAILSPRGHGLHFAIEGDIQGAYDAVPKDKLLSQLVGRLVEASSTRRPRLGVLDDVCGRLVQEKLMTNLFLTS